MPTRVIGAGVFLAAHATVLTTENELYSPDFFGVLSTLLESGKAGCLGGTETPVVAVFNGAEGDVSPAWEPGRRDRQDVLEIADAVATRVCGILPAAVDHPNPDIAFQWDEIGTLTDRPIDDPFDTRDGWEQRTARAAMVGAPAIGGAEDGRTFLHDMGFVEGMRGPVRNDHGAKQSFEVDMLGIRTNVASLVNQPAPKKAPIGVYRLGNLALVTLPGEFTTMLGERIREHLSPLLMPAPERVLLVGLAGGHVSYITTPDEYEAQHYEGAQNLYGAATGGLVARTLEALATAGPSGSLSASRDYCYVAGKGVRWQPRDTAGPPYEVEEGLGDVVQDLTTGEPTADFPTFCFRDAVPRLSQVKPGLCERVMPDVWIETSLGAEVTVDGVSQSSLPGLDVVTVLTGVGTDKVTGKDATEWCAIWMVPEVTPVDQYHFRIEPIVGSAFTSDDFPSGGVGPPAFFQSMEGTPLDPDRPAGILCGMLSFLGLCPQPQTCQAP